LSAHPMEREVEARCGELTVALRRFCPHPHLPPTGDELDRALFVRAKHRHVARCAQAFQHGPLGMAEAVVRADGDPGIGGIHGGQEPGGRGAAAARWQVAVSR
jgi:hypothetical protein